VQNLPVIAAAWQAGEINTAAVETIIRARNPRTEQALVRDQELLVDQAKTLPYPDFVQAMKYWAQFADPDGTEADTAKQVSDRKMHLSETVDGMWIGDLLLDPIGGTVLAEELARLEKLLFEEEWAETKERLGHDPTVNELPRTPTQRRADALIEMAKRSATMPEGGYSPRPLFTVLVDYETVHGRICELANGTVLSPGALVPWLSEAVIERAVFTPTKRVEISAKTRLFTGATRRAIEIRDRHCTHPHCNEPADRCRADHIIPHEAGGPTTQENGRLLCPFHNRLGYQQHLQQHGRPIPKERPHRKQTNRDRQLRLRLRTAKRRTTKRPAAQQRTPPDPALMPHDAGPRVATPGGGFRTRWVRDGAAMPPAGWSCRRPPLRPGSRGGWPGNRPRSGGRPGCAGGPARRPAPGPEAPTRRQRDAGALACGQCRSGV
jgi:Domain of unknown function (DUF222)